MTRVRRTVGIVAALALTVPLLIGSTTVANHAPQIPCALTIVGCPDIIVDGSRFNPYVETKSFSPNSCSVIEGHTQPGVRKLLRFTFTTPNVGLADLIVGAPQNNPAFEYGPCHGHYHFKEYADYRLWTPTQWEAYHALRIANPGVQAHVILEAHPELTPVAGDKRGFCVIDLVRYAPLPQKWTSCSLQGISVGWADEYYHRIDGQWVDVTGLPSGNYVLEAEVNSEHIYEESNYDNNRAWRDVVI